MRKLDLPDKGKSVRNLMTRVDVAIGASTYQHYLELARVANDFGCHWVDYGGKIAVRQEQAKLDAQAKQAGVIISPDNGIAPGAVSIVAQKALNILGGQAETVRMRVGGIPMRNIPPLGYARVFSADGLIQEMEADAEILENGRLKTVSSLTGRGFMDFPSPFNRLEYARTSDGGGTFAETNQGKVQEFDYATLRYPGHWDFMIAMRDLGFWDQDRPATRIISGTLSSGLSPRDMTVALLDKNLPRNEPDALVMRVAARNNGRQIAYDLIAESDPKTGHSAMQRTTAYSGAIVAWMIGRGDISKTGVIRLEKDVPADKFLEQWKRYGLKLTKSNWDKPIP